MTEETPGRVRPFADVLLEVDKGRFHTELSTALQELVGRVVETGKAGSLTVKLAIKPTKGDPLTVAASVAVKRPEFDRAESFFYPDAEHNLLREDPNQQALMPLRDVSAQPSKTRAEAEEAL